MAPGPVEHVTIILASTMAARVGVPGRSLVTTLIVLGAIGMGPQAAAGIALVVVLDRFLDLFRTGVNELSHLTYAAILARGEGPVAMSLLRRVTELTPPAWPAPGPHGSRVGPGGSWPESQ